MQNINEATEIKHSLKKKLHPDSSYLLYCDDIIKAISENRHINAESYSEYNIALYFSKDDPQGLEKKYPGISEEIHRIQEIFDNYMKTIS